MKNVAILTERDPKDWIFKEWNENNIDAYVVFKKIPKFLRAWRRLWIALGIPFQSIWFSKEWQKEILKIDTIILYNMSILLPALPRYLNKLNPNAKVVVYYWNSVKCSIKPSRIKGKCEIWSFDPEDCKKYDMKFNHQYYFKSLIHRQENQVVNDIYFCGRDAGRGELLMDLYHVFSNLGLSVCYQIVKPLYNSIPEELKSPYRSYQEIQKFVSQSRCLLEILKEGQTGATLRLMEALFFKKKIITTNIAVKDEPFYSPRNIFIIGERPNSELADFVKTPYDDSVDKYIDEYDVGRWLKNFEK